VALSQFMLLLALSVVAAVIIAYCYLHFYADRAGGSQIHRSFPLLALAVTAIFISIQFSLPLSLGLLGALSIVRFRTPIKAPEEIAFIMLVVATSLACATFNLMFVVGILLVALTTLLIARWAPALVPMGPTQDGSLMITLDESDYEAKGSSLLQLLEQRLRRGRVESITKNGQEEVAVALSFRTMPPAQLVALEAEMRELVKLRYFTILYNRPGAL
jgi:hypothetical protein